MKNKFRCKKKQNGTMTLNNFNNMFLQSEVHRTLKYADICSLFVKNNILQTMWFTNRV